MSRHSVFFGDVAQDEYYVAPYFPRGGDKVIVRALPPQLGGSVANAATIYAGYGMPTSFMSQLNSGELSQRLLAQLRGEGLDTRHVIFDESVPESHCIVLISGEQNVVIIPTLGITHTEITPEAFEHMAEAEFLVTTLTDVKPFRMGGLASAEILEALRARGTRIVLDLDVYNPENHGSGLLGYADIVFVNAHGAQRMTEAGDSIDALLAGGATAVVVTRDSEGCEVHTRDGSYAVPGVPVDVVDTTGAGDAFTSSYLFAVSTGAGPLEAAEFANAAAARSVTRVGARSGRAAREDVDAFRRALAPVPDSAP